MKETDFEADFGTREEGLIRLDRMYESLRYNDYSTENGLGEIVDNAMEAGAAMTAVVVKEGKVKKEGRKRASTSIVEIAVIDDGCGMDRETLRKCLVLGESVRPEQEEKRGIGRFGVGMTLGSISLARRVEVFSRRMPNEAFLYTYIDLDEIQENKMLRVPEPVACQPEAEYASLLEGLSGTIVIMKACDRVFGSLDTLANYLGRTYRKFIAAGRTITLNGERVYLHDPLYLSGPTIFDVREQGKTDPKATVWYEDKIELEIPGSDGKMAAVIIKMTLLPKQWRLGQGDGGSADAKKRKIDDNEGISILRADREVLYGHVPFITGKKGEASAIDIDRWWGCEISFPPELDDYFQVRYIKRGAEPIQSLKDQIREKIGKEVIRLRQTIRSDRAKKKAENAQKAGAHGKAEETMNDADPVLPRNKRGAAVSEEEAEKKYDSVLDSLSQPAGTQQEREQKKKQWKAKRYNVVLVNYPQDILFDIKYVAKGMIIELNVNHPFYRKVLLPLCGPFDDEPDRYNEKTRIKDAIILMLLSYAKAEGLYENEELFRRLRVQWGTVLATVIEQYDKTGEVE